MSNHENSKGQVGIFIAAAVATLITVGALTLLFKTNTPRPQATVEEPLQGNAELRIEEESFFLYFAEGDSEFLTSEERTVSTARDPWQLGKKIITALLSGPQRGNTRTLPSGTKLRAFYLTDRKVAVVDFSREIAGAPMGAITELLTVYSVVNSLAVNIPEIDAVKILVEGHEMKTLAGHIDITDALKPEMLLVR